ncbi:MAG: hypothetical protein ACJ76X_14510 [Solirubrobacteraceae bacterium]
MSGINRVVAATGLCALAIAGCGGSSSSSSTTSFKQDYQPVVNGFKQTSGGIGTAIQAAVHQSDAQVGTAFQSLAGQWQTQLAKLKTLKPPSSVSSTFATLSSAATRVEADLNAVVTSAQAHSKTAAEQAGSALVKDILAAKAAATTIDQKLGIK